MNLSMSATIDEGPTVVTLIHVYDVEPHRQGELLELLERAVVDVMQNLEGFLSSTVHRGIDGKHVATYAQWARLEDFEATLSNPKAQETARIANAMGHSASALYRVDSVLGR